MITGSDGRGLWPRKHNEKCWRCGDFTRLVTQYEAFSDSRVFVCCKCGAPELRPIQPEDWVGAA